MTSIIIRQARQSDLETLLEFEQGIIAYERPFDTTLKEERISYYDISAMIDVDDIEVLVAEDNGILVASGYAKTVQSKPYQKFEQHAYLGFMFVDPDYRGQGVNNRIVEGLTNWAKSKGLYEIRLEVYSENVAALRAYEKAGFDKNLVEMRMSLDN